MADEKKPDEKATERRPSTPQAKAPTAKRSLLSAAASSDPAVHQVLAELQTARANGDDAEAERLTSRLGDLGYE